MNDHEDLKKLRFKMINDLSWKHTEKLEAKMQFMKANDDLLERKNQR
jgi:hypothetical protein